MKEWILKVLMPSPAGIYLSVPFCKAKCSFCNFASDAFGVVRMDAYVGRLCDEIRNARGTAKRMGAPLSYGADSVYFGGGTPSLLSGKQFTRIFATLREEFEIAADAEMTLECAPGQLADATLEELLRQGVNRVSLGVQSFVDREAAAVGRLHTGAVCEREIARLRAAGVKEIGVDLIAGLPHQTMASWEESLERAIASAVTHVSVYMLEIDDESRLGREVLAGGQRYGAGEVPDEDEAAEMYEKACSRLNGAGIRQYEISNFAREVSASRHNVKYWIRQPYIGFGLDAHSMLPAENGAIRFQNTDDLDEYMADSPDSALPLLRSGKMPEAELINAESAFEESLFLGLRMNVGVDLGELRNVHGETLVAGARQGIAEARDAGLLTIDGERIRLTDRGRMASNEVFSRLLVPVAA